MWREVEAKRTRADQFAKACHPLVHRYALARWPASLGSILKCRVAKKKGRAHAATERREPEKNPLFGSKENHLQASSQIVWNEEQRVDEREKRRTNNKGKQRGRRTVVRRENIIDRGEEAGLCKENDCVAGEVTARSKGL